MTTFEPLTEAELLELEARWLAGRHVNRTPVRLHADGPLAEDWTRHTVDVDPKPMTVRDQSARASFREWLIAAAIVVAFFVGCWCFAKLVAHR